MTVRLGAIELGGTHGKMAVGDGTSPAAEDAIGRVATGDRPPEAVLGDLVAFFERQSLDALGVATFGPVDLREGRLLPSTPKPGWGGLPLRARLEERLGVRVVVETDVNAAAVGETTWGAAQGELDVVYVTVGTGIGAGVLVGGALVGGLAHPEIGHLRIPQPLGREWHGACPYHEGCWEGLASGSALAARYGVAVEALEDEAAWELEADHVAAGLAILLPVLRPRRIVLGGGVMQRPGLLGRVRERMSNVLNPDYFPEAADLADLVRPPALGDVAGLQGAFVLARDAARSAQ